MLYDLLMGIPTRYLLGGAGLYAGVATAAYIRVKSNQCPEVCEHAKRPDGQAFNALADTYDEQIGWDEKLMGITLLRWMLLRVMFWKSQLGQAGTFLTTTACKSTQSL